MVWTHTGLSEALSSKAYGQGFKAALGGGGSHEEEMKGLASKPRGKGKGTGAEAAKDNSQLRWGPCNTHNKQGRQAAQRPWALLGPSQPSVKASPRPQFRAKALALSHSNCGCGAGSVWGRCHLQLSDSSDSWGGKESHSPGNGSPRWCLQVPTEWEREVRAGKTGPTTFHQPKPTPLQALGLSSLMKAITKAFLGTQLHGLSLPPRDPEQRRS